MITRLLDPNYRGAQRLTNNAAELQGAILALEVACTLPPGLVVIGYDSEFARRTIIGEWRSRFNARAIALGKSALNKPLCIHQVEWCHVESHTGHPLNELADTLADSGAEGHFLLPPHRRGGRPRDNL